jgi:hypothetical protein
MAPAVWHRQNVQPPGQHQHPLHPHPIAGEAGTTNSMGVLWRIVEQANGRFACIARLLHHFIQQELFPGPRGRLIHRSQTRHQFASRLGSPLPLLHLSLLPTCRSSCNGSCFTLHDTWYSKGSTQDKQADGREGGLHKAHQRTRLFDHHLFLHQCYQPVTLSVR